MKLLSIVFLFSGMETFSCVQYHFSAIGVKAGFLGDELFLLFPGSRHDGKAKEGGMKEGLWQPHTGVLGSVLCLRATGHACVGRTKKRDKPTSGRPTACRTEQKDHARANNRLHTGNSSFLVEKFFVFFSPRAFHKTLKWKRKRHGFVRLVWLGRSVGRFGGRGKICLVCLSREQGSRWRIGRGVAVPFLPLLLPLRWENSSNRCFRCFRCLIRSCFIELDSPCEISVPLYLCE